MHRTWFFRLSSLAFIVYATPILAVRTRGLLGFAVIMMAAVMAGLIEGSFGRVAHSIRRGVAENKWLMIFAIWYSIGLTLNLMLRGHGLDDWRLMMGPIVLLMGIVCAFGFFGDDQCSRNFQVSFLLVAGIQAALSARQFANSAGIAREMWTELGGSWEYGTQSTFALYAVLIPILAWRASVERGMMRIALLSLCLVIILACLTSSFATPAALLVLSVPVIGILSILQFRRPGQGLKTASLLLILMAVVWFGARNIGQSEIMAPVYSRLDNFLNDPESGGYSGEDARRGSRVYLAEISLYSFRSDPLLGRGGGSTRYSPYVGGHSSFFDSLGAYGLLGGGGAFAGVILVMLAKSGLRYGRRPDWETLTALTTVILLVVAGVANPYWEGAQPALVFLLARPFLAGRFYVRKTGRRASPNTSRDQIPPRRTI